MSGTEPPLVVEATRGTLVESRHRVAVAAVDAKGATVFCAGDVAALAYPRSAIKPIQAIALVESGAADAFGLGDAEIALACASHGGEPRHVEVARAWLARIGLTEDDLECGAHAPNDTKASVALARSGAKPSPLHNNCSGKHSGFLTVARHLGHPTKGYIEPDHPVQRRVIATVMEMAGAPIEGAPRGIDGCGIPVVGMPISSLARAMARFADPAELAPPRRAAIERIRRAMAAEPFLVAGTNRFTTRVIEATGGRVLLKEGAEGVYCGALPQRGIGIALKAEDGAARAAAVAMGHMLVALSALEAREAALLADALSPAIVNVAGREVGRLRVAQPGA
jgi:L-asparaginase II